MTRVTHQRRRGDTCIVVKGAVVYLGQDNLTVPIPQIRNYTGFKFGVFLLFFLDWMPP